MGNRYGQPTAPNKDLGYHEEADKYLEFLIEKEEYDSGDETREEAGIGGSDLEIQRTTDLRLDMVVLGGTDDIQITATSIQEPDVDLRISQLDDPEMLPLLNPESPGSPERKFGSSERKNGSPERKFGSAAMTFGSSGMSMSRGKTDRSYSPDPCSIDPSEYDLPFENIVFEGGGNKGLAHCGALKYLETIGIKDDKIKRVAGASAGAIMAALVALGHSADDIEKEMTTNDMRRMFLDASCFGVLRNLFLYFGMHPANEIYEWLGGKLAEKARRIFREKHLKGEPENITFEQVYKYFGKELCVVVTNLNRMTTEYFHPKTTPRMSVRDAVRMSTSLPGMFTSKWFRLYGQTDVFVDGGVLCNYPIHCFDGWYLSMDDDDNFTEKMQGEHSLDNLYESRFIPRTNKTLGISIYAEHDHDFLKNVLEERLGTPEPKRPDPRPCGEQTELYQEWKTKDEYRKRSNGLRKHRDQATKAFLEMVYTWTKVKSASIIPDLHVLANKDKLDRRRERVYEKILRKSDKDKNGEIDRVVLNKALEEPCLKDRKHLIFFVEDPNKVFDDLTNEETGKIPFKSLLGELGDLGIHIHSRFLGSQRKNIESFSSFLDGLQSTLLINVKRSIVKSSDVDRTVGINTGHVETNSFDLDEEDKNFVITRGQNRCKRFLQNYIADNYDTIHRKKDLPNGNESTDA